MEYPLDLQQAIINGLNGLPEKSLREIAEYVFFIRQKTLKAAEFQQQLQLELLSQELSSLEKAETNHLEEEFKSYQDIYPKESQIDRATA